MEISSLFLADKVSTDAVDVSLIVTYQEISVEGKTGWAGHVGGSSESALNVAEAAVGIGVDTGGQVVGSTVAVVVGWVDWVHWRRYEDVLTAVSGTSGGASLDGWIVEKSWWAAHDGGDTISALNVLAAVVWMVEVAVAPAPGGADVVDKEPTDWVVWSVVLAQRYVGVVVAVPAVSVEGKASWACHLEGSATIAGQVLPAVVWVGVVTVGPGVLGAQVGGVIGHQLALGHGKKAKTYEDYLRDHAG